ncbi:diaminopimelate epimerase [bacterium]|nr:diaminopimelate epimerase [bacterium]
MEFELHKFEGAGNDFVILDDREDRFPAGEEGRRLIQLLCDRRRGIGADGLMLLQPSPEDGLDFRMRYYNADGGEAEMCGNGARCLARFAHQVGAAGASMRFLTEAGVYSAEVSGSRVSVAFPDIPATPRDLTLEALGREWDCSFLLAGVPHLIVWVDDLANAAIDEWGRALRFHPEFQPAGTNVNFAQPDAADPEVVRIRTYERGVEGETLACGTGAVASAICFAHRKGRPGPNRIGVIPTSGDRLNISFTSQAENTTGVHLEGPARRVFATTVDIADLTEDLPSIPKMDR